jgi:hypothetical protein
VFEPGPAPEVSGAAAILRRLPANRARTYGLVALAAALPRLVALLYERGGLLADPAFVEKSAMFARTFVESGTYGYYAGIPSAETQPLYGFFLVPIIWIFGDSWLAIGVAQTALGVVTAWLVYEIGRWFASSGVGLLAALISTLHPYLVWHDIHVSREIVDQVVAAAVALLALAAGDRGSLRMAALLGSAAGLAILGNVRLVLLPVVLGGYLLWRLPRSRRSVLLVATMLGAAVLVVAPWLVRNRVEVGCFALTTDAQALWKANNVNTYRTLASPGKSIDDVPPFPSPPHLSGECARMRFYRGRVADFWHDHPGEKLRLAGQAVAMLWDPRPRLYEIRSAKGGFVDLGRLWGEPLFMGFVYLFAVVGLAAAARRFAVLALALLGYQTITAIVFWGTTRYRVAWDFLLALLAAAGLALLAHRCGPTFARNVKRVI